MARPSRPAPRRGRRRRRGDPLGVRWAEGAPRAWLRRRRDALPWLVPLALVGMALVAYLGARDDVGERGGDDGGGARSGLSAPLPAPIPPPVRALAERLPLDARAGQLFLVDTGGAPARTPGWGGLRVPPDGPGAALRRALRRPARGGVAPLVAAGGLPSQPSLAGATAAEIAAAYREAAEGLRGRGVALALGLSADVTVSGGPLGGVTFRGDAAQVRADVASALSGMRAGGLAVAVGRFPGEGTATQSPQDGPASVGLSRRALARRDLLPFGPAARSAAAIAVSSAAFAAFDAVTPAALSPEVVGVELRRRLEFGGLVLSGDLGELENATGEPPGRAAVLALRAGVDMVAVADQADAAAARRAVLAALDDGTLPEARFREALGRVLDLKRRLGIL